jgi:hypothetical protein
MRDKNITADRLIGFSDGVFAVIVTTKVLELRRRIGRHFRLRCPLRVRQAGKSRVAVEHVNIADVVLLKGVLEAARELKVPVIVGASARELVGTRACGCSVWMMTGSAGIL